MARKRDATRGLAGSVFLGEDGIPVALRRVRLGVEARGGWLIGSGAQWTLYHPAPHVSSPLVEFLENGDVRIHLGSERIYVDVDDVHDQWPGYDRTQLEYDLEAILGGGYAEFTAYNAHGQTAHGWRLARADQVGGSTVFDITMAADDPENERIRRMWRYEWRWYPGWPPPPPDWTGWPYG